MRVLICGLLNTPNGDAGALRQHKLAIMCRELGYEPLVVGLGKANRMQPLSCDGITYISFYASTTTIIFSSHKQIRVLIK